MWCNKTYLYKTINWTLPGKVSENLKFVAVEDTDESDLRGGLFGLRGIFSASWDHLSSSCILISKKISHTGHLLNWPIGWLRFSNLPHYSSILRRCAVSQLIWCAVRVWECVIHALCNPRFTLLWKSVGLLYASKAAEHTHILDLHSPIPSMMTSAPSQGQYNFTFGIFLFKETITIINGQ